MTSYETRESDTEVEGCLIAIEVMFDNEGELSIEQLEDIHEVMSGIGSERTGQRVRVKSRPDSKTSAVVYVYQEALGFHTRDQMGYLYDRFEIKTDFDDPSFIFGTEVVEMRET